MSKKIISIGYEIPGHSDDYVSFGSEQSLMEADILLISPDSLGPSGHWVSYDSSDGGCYDVDASRTYKQKISHFKKEIEDHLNAGKNVFVLLTKKEEYSLAISVSTEKKGQRLYSTERYSNYNFLPISIGALVSATGKHVEFSKDQIFDDFYKTLGKHLEYQLYIENAKDAQIIFTGKVKTKVLGAVFKVGNGHLVVLPYIAYNHDVFVKRKKDKKGFEKAYWTDTAIKFGNTLVGKLTQIDKDLQQDSEKTPPPEWSQDKKFLTKSEEKLLESISDEKEAILKAEQKIRTIEMSLSEEQVLRGLLFEQGKPLEQAVTRALHILGYMAEGYDDGTLELDHVILSPEGYRYIGECEGKDSKGIDITKFRQLTESMSADFAREGVSEKAFGILFGNPQRLMNPADRSLDFTDKCKIGAIREKIALVKTTDLFSAAKYISETKDEAYKKGCRDAIHSGLGSIVIFPEPKAKK